MFFFKTSEKSEVFFSMFLGVFHRAGRESTGVACGKLEVCGKL